jgi:hypothetical protein
VPVWDLTSVAGWRPQLLEPRCRRASSFGSSSKITWPGRSKQAWHICAKMSPHPRKERKSKMAILFSPFTAPVIGPVLWTLIFWAAVAAAVWQVTR